MTDGSAALATLRSVVTTRGTAVIVAVVGLLGAVALIALLGEAALRPSPTYALPQNADSTTAALLQERLPAEDTSAAVALFTVGEAGGSERFTASQLRQVEASVETARRDLGLPPGGPGLRPAPDGPPPSPSCRSTPWERPPSPRPSPICGRLSLRLPRRG
jgi:hypothetical protein